MADEHETTRNQGQRSFEERIFARIDAIDARLNSVDARLDNIDSRMVQLEAKRYDTKPIWERALADIAELRGDLVKEIGGLRSYTTKEIKELRRDTMKEIAELRKDSVEIKESLRKINYKLAGISNDMYDIKGTLQYHEDRPQQLNPQQ